MINGELEWLLYLNKEKKKSTNKNPLSHIQVCSQHAGGLYKMEAAYAHCITSSLVRSIATASACSTREME